MVKKYPKEQSNDEYFLAIFRNATMEMLAPAFFSDVIMCKMSRAFYFKSLYFNTSKMQMHAEEQSICNNIKVEDFWAC